MKRIEVSLLRRAMQRALEDFELTPAHVDYVVETLVETSLNGIDTHGVRLLETYVKELEGGRCKSHPNLKFTSVLPAIGLLDADDALGVVAANEAIRLAIPRAKTFGVSAIAISNSNHCGAIGYYAMLAAKEGLIGLTFTNSDALVAPFNGATALNGTNPIGMAAPGLGDDLFGLDMSTSQTSFLKALRAMAAEIPADNDTPNVGAASARQAPQKLREPLQPLGGYKGQGLGMMVQILSAVLTNMPFDHQLTNMYDAPYDAGRKIGHLFICLDIQSFCPLPVFRSRLTELLEIFRRSPAVGDTPAVSVPGDFERRARSDRQQHGIPVSDEAWRFFEPHIDAVAACNA